MKINVLYFANLRECAETNREIIEIADGATVNSALDCLCRSHPPLAKRRPIIRTAVNEDMAVKGTRLVDGDTLALMTPFAGGSEEEPYCRLTQEPIDVNEVYRAVNHRRQGGIVTFTGLVRDHNHGKDVERLEYEAYPEMVLKSLRTIIQRCEALAPDIRVAVVHRYGKLDIGDVAVVVAASAPHRAEAFDAARKCIDWLKEETPIWKKEISPDGEEWIGMGP
jgi:molybdopterin synthase catalytic subunit